MGALSWETIAANAWAFLAKWREAQSEKADSQTFLGEFFRIFDHNELRAVDGFEVPINLDDGHSGYIDYFLPKKIAIEMKLPDMDLKKAYE